MWLPQSRQEQSGKWLMNCCLVSLKHYGYTHQSGIRVRLFIKAVFMSSNWCCQLCPGNQSLLNFIVIILQWNGTFLVNLQNFVNPVKLLKSQIWHGKFQNSRKSLCVLAALKACVCVTDLVAQGALLRAYVCDEVAGLLGHLVQEHVAKGQAAVSDVVPLQGGTDKETLEDTSLSTNLMLS